MELEGREIVLGVTGGIAAYKSCEIVSRLRKEGAKVHVVMTEHATRFVQPLTFETMSGNPVAVDTFVHAGPWEVEHIALAKRAELFLIAPATANIIAKMASGIADDMLSTTVLATKAPVMIAPAMNTGMWTAPATVENVATLKRRGVIIVGPDSGKLACGDTGSGRMSEPEEIVNAVICTMNTEKDLSGLKIMVTAGATRERIDPVRFISNDSSGKMGFAIAKAAKDRGAQVLLVCGITTAPKPDGIELLQVESTQQLFDAVTSRAPQMDVIIQAAAPADYRPINVAAEKIKKENGSKLILEMVENPDIAAEVGRMKKQGQTLVGFAAETEKVTANARGKLARKNLDMIVANDVTAPGAGFNVDTNIATIITASSLHEYPLQTKLSLAHKILDEVVSLRKEK